MFTKIITFSDQMILPFESTKIFDVVIDVEEYPNFIPWCRRLKIVAGTESQITADCTIEFKQLTASYRSEITFQAPSEDGIGYIQVRSTEGAFKYLKNDWEFHSRGIKRTLVKFSIECQLQSKFMHYTMSVIYKQAQQKIIKAFQDRIYSLH